MAENQQVPDDNTPVEDPSTVWNQEAAARAAGPDVAPPIVEEAPTGPSEDVQAILDRIGNFENLVTKLTHEVSSQTGRVAAIQREMAQARAASTVVERAPNSQAVAAASKSLAKWEQLKTDFPDWAVAIEERVDASAPVSTGPDMGAIQAMLQTEVGQLRQEVTRGLEEAKIYGAHRDWKTEVVTPRFAEWFKTLPPEDQAVYDSVNGDDVIRVLDMWAEHKRNSVRDVRAERSQILQNAVAPRRTAAAAPIDPSTLTPEQLWALEAQQRVQSRAQRGRS